MSQGTKQQAVRLPVELHAKIVAAATENNRSGHAEMLHRLAASFSDPNQIVIDVLRGDLNALEERLLKKLAPEVFVNTLSFDASGISKEDLDKMREKLKGAGMYAELSVLHGSATGRLSESQPEISGLSTLPQAIRRGHTERLPLEGQTWVITGSLETMSRDKARDYLIQMGAEVAGVVVAGKTCGLLWGPGAGSKLVKAKQHGVQLMDEVGFLDLLRAMAILPPEAEDQHLTVPGALEWDRPGEETSWRVHDGLNPVGLCISADTIVEVERRDGVKLPADRAGDFNWIWDASLLPSKDPAEIYAWRLAPGAAEYPGGWIENTGICPVEGDAQVEVKWRGGGDSTTVVRADRVRWDRLDNEQVDITHWRLAK